ncbi:MAG: hypothetical protein WAM66_13610 [Acidobacteriaceae bacterium]
MLVVLPPLPVRSLIAFTAPIVIDVMAVRALLPPDVIWLLALRPHRYSHSPVRGAARAEKRHHQYSNQKKLSKFSHAAFLSISFEFLHV